MINDARRRNYVALVIGLILTISAAIAVNDRLIFINSSAQTQGKVIRLNHGAHHPEIAFATQNGTYTTFSASFITAEIGDSVPVRYNPAMPRETAEINKLLNIWFEPIILSVFAIAFIFAGWAGKEFRGRYG